MTAVSDRLEEHARPAPAARRFRYEPTHPEQGDALRAARRHTARVRRLKVLLPALAIVGAVVFWSALRIIPSDMGILAKGAGVDVTSDSVVMNKPRISGFEGTRRAYEVEAESAVQSLSDPKIVTFNRIGAKLGLDGAGTATLDATTGVYDGHANTLALKDGIVIATNTGYSAATDAAAVDLDKGTLATTVPIEIKMTQGTIRANSISVTDRGKHVVFSGGVSMTFLPPGDLAAAPGKP